jgi:hypothetical protein
VIFWLQSRGLAATDEVVARVFAVAKASPTVLSDEEVLAALDAPAPTPKVEER